MMATLAPLAPAKAKPPVPPLVRIDAHYRKFLATRWVGLSVRAAVLTSLALFLVPMGARCGYTLLSALGTLFVAGPVTYLFGTHVLLRVRRSWITSPPTLPAKPSRAALVFGTFTPRVVGLLAAYVVFGIVFALSYGFTLTARSPEVALGWFTPAGRYKWHGNERLWFLVSGTVVFFFSIGLRDVFATQLGPRWPRTRLRFPEAVRRSLVACLTGFRSDSALVHDISLAAFVSFLYSVIYFSFRRWAWRWAVTHIPIIRPFVINFAKKSNVTWTLGWHLFILETTAIVAIKPALAVLNDYLTQPLNFASFTAKSPFSPEKYLLTALDSKNKFYVHHTLIELQRLAHNKAQRTAIFADVARPAQIHLIFKVLLIQLGKNYEVLANRGAAPKAKAKAQVHAPSAPDAHSVAIKTGDIFKPAPKRTGLKAIVGTVLEGTARPTPAPVLAAAHAVENAEVAVVKRVEKPIHEAEEWAVAAPFIGPIIRAGKLANGGFTAWVGKEWASRSVAAAVPDLDVLARIVDTLTTLAVASADEDTYGYTQAVLPSALEAFVRFRMAALALEKELLGPAGKIAPDGDADVRADIAKIVDTFDDGVTRIAGRFGTTLTAFRFPTPIAQALTDICRSA
ncbi:uncharacterized protein LOC62_01G001257 [Vanrija pseudolonga]|uniref:Nucleoporin protein Ndc1-Nup n=1 Tax=Vanrija pseudolonga TaxID=143232 RepID=A0AAF0Y428_9TREE|nr:hypothetical protein LOC62_01G001257 [Vanrija pseudolonga]